MKKLLTVLLVLGLWGCSSKKDTGSDTNNQENVKVEEKQQAKTMTLSVNKQKYKVTLLSNKSANSLLSIAPIELNCAKDRHGYFCELDNALNVADKTAGAIKKGDLYVKGGHTLYIATKAETLNTKITRLGTIDEKGVDALTKSDGVGTINK